MNDTNMETSPQAAATVSGEGQVLSGPLKLRFKGKVAATFDPDGSFRGDGGKGRVQADGQVKLKGKTIGRIEGDRIRVYTGKTVGRFDGAAIRNAAGKRIASLDAEGVIRLANAKRVGQIDGDPSAEDLAVLAGYLVLVDPVERRS